MFRVMIAEDEPLLRRSIVEKIGAIDPDFKVAGEYENGEYAMLEVELIKPHVLLTDIYMPVMDGLSLIRHVKDTSPSTVCAILTGYRDFDYAWKSMELGVTDFLLKPPTVDNLSKFLKDAKEKLWKNQSLMEGELLRQWAFGKPEDKLSSADSRRMAQEFFYHSGYIVLLGWVPQLREQAAGAFPGEGGLPALLEEGEKGYAVPTPAGNQWLAVIGVHDLGSARVRRLLDAAALAAGGGPVCLTATTVVKPDSELSAAIGKLLRAASYGFPLEGTKTWALRPDELSFEKKMLPVPGSFDAEFVSLLVKQKKSELLKKLGLLFQSESWRAGTREQWFMTLSYLMNGWILHPTPFSVKAGRTHWNHELEETVWQAEDAEGLKQSLLEYFASLFDFEGDEESEASWIEDVKDYLDARYMDNVSLTDLADRFGLNPSYLGRMFKRKYRYSPIDYLIHIRLEKAKGLIRERPRLLFKDIAEMVGYGDPFYFSKLFKQWTGQTPREYKKSKPAE